MPTLPTYRIGKKKWNPCKSEFWMVKNSASRPLLLYTVTCTHRVVINILCGNKCAFIYLFILCWYFQPSFEICTFLCCHSPLLSGSTLPPPPFPCVNKYTVYTYTLGGGGVWGSGPQTNTCRKVPLQVNYFRWRHFALVSILLISRGLSCKCIFCLYWGRRVLNWRVCGRNTVYYTALDSLKYEQWTYLTKVLYLLHQLSVNKG